MQGIGAYLLKPIQAGDLYRTVQSVLTQAPAKEPQGRLITRHALREKRDRLKVLVAEDNPVNRVLARKLLELAGHSVQLVQNGQEAFDAWEAGSFDLILMDVHMPEMDGFEATALIRERERDTDGHVPVIALTASAIEGDRERCLDAGMDDYVPKPLSRGDLYNVMNRLTSNPAPSPS